MESLRTKLNQVNAESQKNLELQKKKVSDLKENLVKSESEVSHKIDDTQGKQKYLGTILSELEEKQKTLAESSFAFDRVFDSSASTSQVYSAVAPMISSLLDGLNCTLLAFGQTSSGKTHSMLGTPEEPGIMVLAAGDLLSRVCLARRRASAGLHTSIGALPASGGSISVRASCCEVYNEQCNDLLAPGSNLRLYEQATGAGPSVIVADLSSHAVASVQDVARLLHAAEATRRVGSTGANDRSSRSHLLFSLSVHVDGEQSGGADSAAGVCTSPSGPRASISGAHDCADGMPMSRRVLGTLQLVDLAGSERVHGARGEEQREESSHINRSLLTLGTIISRLSERSSTVDKPDQEGTSPSLERSASVGSTSSYGGLRAASRTSSPRRAGRDSPHASRGGCHLPYRDSKLTRLLQPSLSGDARMLALCTVSPASSAADETLNTLRFATRIKRVVAMPQASATAYDASAALVASLRSEVRQLRLELAAGAEATRPEGMSAHRSSPSFISRGTNTDKLVSPSRVELSLVPAWDSAPASGFGHEAVRRASHLRQALDATATWLRAGRESEYRFGEASAQTSIAVAAAGHELVRRLEAELVDLLSSMSSAVGQLLGVLEHSQQCTKARCFAERRAADTAFARTGGSALAATTALHSDATKARVEHTRLARRTRTVLDQQVDLLCHLIHCGDGLERI
jgi:hypothetical protein